MGFKAKTELELHHRKVAVDTAKPTKDDAEVDMNLFAVDGLGPKQKALEEAEENKNRYIALMN